MARKTFQIPSPEAREILSNDNDRFEVVKTEKIGDSRWAVVYDVVIRETATGDFYQSEYREGTGDMGERPWEYDDFVDFQQVFPKTVETVTYE
jgi:hypothetical protein